MRGNVQVIAERPTYFPPFVNERFDTPFWSCTFASLLNGVNVAYRGEQPATHEEVIALAHASNDAHLKGGSRARHMVQAMKVRYGQDVAIRHLPVDRVKTRLAHGWAMVAGMTYGQLPDRYRLDRTFKGGHRVVVLGWSDDNTWILDPLANEGRDYTGRKIPWSVFERAWWSSEQVWFRDGMYLPQPDYTDRTDLPKPRELRAKPGTELKLWSPIRAGVIAKQVELDKPLREQFDARRGVIPPKGGKGPARPRIRIATGKYRGYYLDPGTPGVDADLSGTPEDKQQKAAKVDDTVVKAKREEWDRIDKALNHLVRLPARP